jgi:hypothetical protein
MPLRRARRHMLDTRLAKKPPLERPARTSRRSAKGRIPKRKARQQLAAADGQGRGELRRVTELCES